MKQNTIIKIVSVLSQGPKPIEDISRRVKTGWKTCERYIDTLKKLGIVGEIRTRKERIFYLAHAPRLKLATVPRVRVDTTIEFLDEEPPNEREVEDLS